MRKKIVVLVSGSGSNLQAIIDACERNDINGDVIAVLSNKPDVFALQRAKRHNIESVVLDHTAFRSREAFDAKLAEHIKSFSPDLIVLAGFMRILSEHFVALFAGKMLNIHPSLLPKYPGLNTHQRALDNNDNWHGASIHFVTAQLDGGPVIIQSKVPITDHDNADTLASKVAEKEWQIYPLVVKWYCDDRLCLVGSSVALDKTTIIKQGLMYEDLVNELPDSSTNISAQ